MIVHENVELLSSFVDNELEPPERQAVESHLEGCPPCRRRLRGLRRVVEELQGLEVTAPPTELAARVRRAVLFDGGEASVLRRTEDSLRRWTEQPLLLPLFGVVTAMAVLLYLFTAWSDQAGTDGTRVVIPPPAEIGEVRVLEARTFHRVGGRWVEDGVDADSVARWVSLESPDAEWTAVEPFRRLGGRVVLRYDGQVIEVAFEP